MVLTCSVIVFAAFSWTPSSEARMVAGLNGMNAGTANTATLLMLAMQTERRSVMWHPQKVQITFHEMFGQYCNV